MTKSDKDKLISAVYSASMSPDNFDDTLNNIDDLIFIPVSKASEVSNPVIDPDIFDHIQRAFEIQLRVGRDKNEKNKALILLDTAPNPAFIFDHGENIIAMNDHAKNLGQGKFAKLKECCTDTQALQDIRKFIGNGIEQKLLIVPGFNNPQQNANTCVLVRKIDLDSTNKLLDRTGQSEKLYFFTAIGLGFDPAKTGMFRKTYDLTPAEADIAIQLASGKQLTEIAVMRGSTITTIRTQFKSIKKKTSSRDISGVVRLLCGFSAGISMSSQLSSSGAPIIHVPSGLKTFRQIVLRDGRQMTYLEQGNPTGAPVMMFHNMPYGVELPQKAIEAAIRMNLRIISPYRPGFGNSDPIATSNNDELLSEVAADMCELMDQLNITKASIVGHSSGSIYVLRFARLFPNRVLNLFAISRPPIWRDEWLDGMPKRQRFIMRIVKYMPQLLPLITRATVMYIDKGYGEELVYSLVKDCEADRQALIKYPEIVQLMARGCEEGLKQGAEAFNRDCHLSIMDFSEEARTLSHSFYILHGDADEIINIRQSRKFARLVPGTELEVVKGAGQLLFYSHWDRVLKAIKNKLQR